VKALEEKLRKLFGVGILLAFVLLACGRLFGPAVNLESLRGLARYSPSSVGASLRVGSFSFWGLVVLVSIPFLRVLLSVFYFSKSGERVMVALSGLVLLGLVLGLWLGLIS
jgi:hypothetical protein